MEVEICQRCFAVIVRDRKTDHAQWHALTDHYGLEFDRVMRSLDQEVLVLHE